MLKREKVSWVAFIDLNVCAGDQQARADELHFLLAAIVRMFFHCWSISWRTSLSEKWRTLLILGRAGWERVSRWVPASLVPSWGTLTEGAICGWDDVWRASLRYCSHQQHVHYQPQWVWDMAAILTLILSRTDIQAGFSWVYIYRQVW